MNDNRQEVGGKLFIYGLNIEALMKNIKIPLGKKTPADSS